MSKFTKKFLCLLCCFMIVITSFSGTVFAGDYEKYDSTDDDGQDNAATYYIIDGEDFADLWDFGIDDCDNLLDWIWNFRTYTVIKKYTNDEGEEVYRGYFNTPNLQHLAKNYVTSLLADGYTDDTYDVNETEWLVNVGADAPSVNVITKYGFDVPSYSYNGEYPKEIMTVAGVLPTNFWDTLWRAVKAFFGASFIKAPDASNFNTITYLNHGYIDKEDYLTQFFCDYYIPYFLGRLANGRYATNDSSGYVEDQDDLEYFEDIEDFIDQTITNEENESAEDWITDNLDFYKQYKKIQYGWNNFANATPTSITRFGLPYGNNGWSNTDETTRLSYIGLDSGADEVVVNLAHSDQGMTTTTAGAELPYEDLEEFLRTQNDYLNAVRDWWESDKNNNAAILQSIILNNPEHEYYNNMLTGNISDVVAFFDEKINGSNEDTAEVVINCLSDSAPIGDWYFRRGLNDVLNPTTEDIENNPNNADIRIADSSDPAMTTSGFDVEEQYITNQSEIDTWNSTPEDEREGDPPEPEYGTFTHTYSYATGNYYYRRGSDPDNFTGVGTIDYNAVLSFYTICLPNYTFTEENWLDPSMLTLMSRYDDCVTITNKWDHFNAVCDMIADNDDFKPEGDGMKGIAYSQCLITVSEGQDENSCINNDYGEETTITVGSLLAYSGLYQLTPDWDMNQYLDFSDSDASNMYWIEHPDIYEDYETLTPEVAHRIINFIKNASGPHYSDVMSNLVIIMLFNAADAGDIEPFTKIHSDDVRVMPYDTASLTIADANNYSITDPRVDIYKEQIIGGFVSDMTISFGGIFKFFTPQKTLITIIGKITEFSVFMQQLCNFDLLDEYGLSPTTIWSVGGFATFVMACLVLFFIFKTVKCVIDICKGSRNSNNKVLVGFLVLFLELGFIVAVWANPTKAWTTIKQLDSSIINLGEYGTIYNHEELTYLFGDAADIEVTYYFPYLDAWSKYNTGYGILANEQLLDESQDLPELQKFENPKLGSNNIGHWSVLLMDSFEYHGHSNSVYNSITIADDEGNFENVNGIVINNNAYRVVDHFLAPRIDFDESSDGSSIDMDVTANENYNGEFQKGVADLFVKLLLAIFICFLSMIKLLTFFWQWYMFYIFFFRVVLGKLAENKSWGKILLQTIAPTAAMIIEGSFVGISLEIGMNLEGFLGVVVIIGLFILTLYMISWWYQLGNGAYFPGTLKWVYAVSTFFADPAHRRSESYYSTCREADDMIDREYADQSEEWRRIMKRGTLEEQKNLLFNEDGTLKDEYKSKRFNKAVGKYINHYQNKIKNAPDDVPLDIKEHIEKFQKEDDVRFDKCVGAYRKSIGLDKVKEVADDKDIDTKFSDEDANWRETIKSGSIEDQYKLLCNEDGSFKTEYGSEKYETVRNRFEADVQVALDNDPDSVPEELRKRYDKNYGKNNTHNEEQPDSKSTKKGKTDDEADKQTDSKESENQEQETGDE